MTAYRFVNRDGWEKWIDLEVPLPHVWKIADPIELPRRFTADVNASYRVRMFVRQPWSIEPWPREQVYVEDDVDPVRFGTNVPSLHRERQYREALQVVERIIDEEERAGAGFGAIGEAISVMGAIERIRRMMRGLHDQLLL